MKKIIPFLLFCQIIAISLVFGAVDTKDGTAITSTSNIDGFTPNIDDCDGQVVKTAVACSSCTPGDPADMFCEDFEGGGGGLICSWDATTGTPAYTAHSVADILGCSDKGAYSAKFDLDSTPTVEHITKNLAGSEANLYAKVYITLDESGLDDNDGSHILRFLDDDSSYDVKVYAQWQAGTSNWKLVVKYRNAAEGEDVMGLTDFFSDATWLEVSLTWESGTKVELSAYDGTTTSTRTDTTDIHATNIEKVQIGTISGITIGAGNSMILEVDILKVDNDTMPGDCSGTSP